MKDYVKYLIGAFAVLFLLLFLAAYPYHSTLKVYPFLTGADTLGGVSAVDTVKWQLGCSDLNATGAWNTFSTKITAANKVGEQTVVFQLANETNWGWGEQVRIRISSAGGSITSGWIYIGDRAGALTLFVQPDTLFSTTPDTTIYKVRLFGQ